MAVSRRPLACRRELDVHEASQNVAAASRLIKEAVEAGLVVPDDPDAAPKLRRYVPTWAAPDRERRA